MHFLCYYLSEGPQEIQKNYKSVLQEDQMLHSVT